MEAELFGYARGAFSGAVQRYDGQLMAAEGGTVFLDEIDDTPLETQVKLLRVLEDRVVSRLGENVWHEVDFRHPRRDQPRPARRSSPRARSAPTSTSAWRSSRSDLPPLRERLEDLARAAAALHRALRARAGARRRSTASGADALRGARRRIRGPATSASCATCIYEALVYKRAGTSSCCPICRGASCARRRAPGRAAVVDRRARRRSRSRAGR